MKVLIDMNQSPRWVGVLIDASIEATHWATCGEKNAPDSGIMAYAGVNKYVVLTHGLDFGAILAATHGEKPSVV
jgi:predicted nuclease of predicted toxin-antitoxin system